MFESVKSIIAKGTGRKEAPDGITHPRLVFDKWPAAIYAIGDVHGCLDHLRRLEEKIVNDAAAIEGEKWIVMIGDYVDRGPRAAGVIDHLIADPPEGFRRFCLLGNHEDVMLKFLLDPMRNPEWMSIGGADTTLASYGIDIADIDTALHLKRVIGGAIPKAHIAFLKSLPVLITLPGVAFAHAGVRPGIPLEEQRDDDLVWIRPGGGPTGIAERVVHGHTPVREPHVADDRINIDTGAFVNGRLTAVRLLPGGDTKILSVYG